MADEKNLDNEIMNDEELEGVAGGAMKETFEDRDELTKLGFYKFDTGLGLVMSVQSAYHKLGQKLGVELNCNSFLSTDFSNRYRIDDRKVTREEFWTIINESIAANK